MSGASVRPTTVCVRSAWFQRVGSMSNDTEKSIMRHIEKSKRTTTILFTDIERSTRFWDKYGDTAGRMMVDAHNKLMFPIVRSFHGTIIKTIGDSIMASFKSSQDAVCAAIAMQQLLRTKKRKSSQYKFRVRIGIHTGRAIIEQSDVFGDVVNVASRIESRAQGGEILVSESVVQDIRDTHLKKAFVDRCKFVPKGKREALVIYKCNWLKHPDITDQVKTTRIPAMPMRQKIELLVYFLVICLALWGCWHYFLRYFFADIEFFSLYLLDPHPVIPLVFLLALIELVVIIRPRIHRVSTRYLMFLKGAFGFGMFWLVMFGLIRIVGLDFGSYFKKEVYRSNHLFVKIVADKVDIYAKPSQSAGVIKRAESGRLFLQSQLVRSQRRVWTKILLESRGHRYGYVQRWVKNNGEELRQTLAGKFYVRMEDLYALLVGLLGFIWGIMTFRLRPI